MKCPHCKKDTRVLESRDSEGALRRRRECEKCGRRFTTYERVETTNLLVVKKNGDRQQFNREKLKVGILRSTEKRPVSMAQVERMLDEIEDELKRGRGSEVTSKRLGELVMQRLKRIDKVAYIRFASVYREFDDIESFEKELKVLQKN